MNSLISVTDLQIVSIGEECISVQEEMESASGTQIDAMDKNGNGNETRGTDAEVYDDDLYINEPTGFISKLLQTKLLHFPLAMIWYKDKKSQNAESNRDTQCVL